MKKIFSILAIAVMALTSEAQNTVAVYKGKAAVDTLIASATRYSPSVNLNFANMQAAFITVAIDSISGAPAGRVLLQHSVDNIHWTYGVGDTVCTWTNTGWAIGGRNTGDPISNISFFKAYTPFNGAYCRFVTFTTSATQKERLWITIKSVNYNK